MRSTRELRSRRTKFAFGTFLKLSSITKENLMGDRPSSIARKDRSCQAAAARTALRHASRSQPRLRDRAPGSTPEVHPTVPDPRHGHRARQGAALPRGHAARAAALRGQGEPRPARAQGAGAGGRGFEIASTAELDLLLGLGVPGGGDLLLQPGQVARVDRLRRRQGRGVVRGRQRRRAAPRASRSSPTPSCTCASPRPTSAATGRCPASSARARPTRARSSPRRRSSARTSPA